MTSPRSCVIQSDLAFWFWSVSRKVCDGAVFISMPSHMRGSLSGDAPVPNYRKRVMHVCLPYPSYIGRLIDWHSSSIWHMFPLSWKKTHTCVHILVFLSWPRKHVRARACWCVYISLLFMCLSSWSGLKNLTTTGAWVACFSPQNTGHKCTYFKQECLLWAYLLHFY